MSLSLRASAPPASSSTGSPQPVVRSLKAFSLYASPHEETAAMVAARRALMSRKSLSVEEASERARERRRAASQIQRFDRPARWLALALSTILPVLLAGLLHLQPDWARVIWPLVALSVLAGTLVAERG